MEVKLTDCDITQEANEYAVSHKKLCLSSRKLSLESSGLTQKRGDYDEGNEASKSLPFLNESQKQIEVEGAKKAFSQIQKHENEENGEPNHHLSHAPQNLSVASLGPVVPQVGNSYKQELHQCEDSKSTDDNINTRSKKHEMHVSPRLLSFETHSNTKTGASTTPQSLNSIELQPQSDFMGAMESASKCRSRKKLSLVEKKLSLGFTGSLETREEDNKENVERVHKRPLLHSSSSSVALSTSNPALGMSEAPEQGSGNNVFSRSLKKYGNGRKLSLGPLTQHSQSLSSDQSRPVPVHECRIDQKQHSNQDHNDTTAKEVKKQKTEKSPISEAVIVLDSEDSEEENVVSVRPKPLLARKRLGKWKLRA